MSLTNIQGPFGLRDYVRFVKVVLPMFGLHSQPFDNCIEILQRTDAFAPRSMYCVPPRGDTDSRKQAMERYAMLFKDSLVDIFLYVEADQPFCWSPILFRLPKELHQLSILPMLPLVKDAEPGQALSFHETRNLLATYAARRDTLHIIELRFLHLDMTDMALEQLCQLPRLTSLLLASPRGLRPAFPIPIVQPPSTMEGSNLGHWPMLKSLCIKGYPLQTAAKILRTCRSTSLTTLTLRTDSGTDSTPFSLICRMLSQKWGNSLVKLSFGGPTGWNDDPVVDVDHIIQALVSFVNLRILHIDSRHIMSHLHLQHLISIGRAMPKLQDLRLHSLSEAIVYQSHLKLFDLSALIPLPELLSVMIEIGQIRANTPAENEYYSSIPFHASECKINDITVLSSTHDSSALRQCNDLFPRVTIVKHISVSHVDADSSEQLSL